MASAAYATAGPESVITVKINYDGATRRAKMVLRDMVPGQLEQQVRTFIGLPSDHELLIERYSDSAGTYVVLDNANVAVYKQLYRAAKAKYKLKLRVFNKTLNSSNAEKVPDAPSATEISQNANSDLLVKDENPVSSQTTPLDSQATSSSVSHVPVEITLPLRNGPVFKTYDSDSLSQAAKQYKAIEELHKDVSQRLEDLSKLPRFQASAAQRQQMLRDIQSGLHNRSFANPAAQSTSQLPSEAPLIRTTPGFAVCCNSCDKTMPDVHYHCSTCDDGDFDLCSSCVDLGITCHSTSHWMIKRTTINGQIVNSTTEVLPPKPRNQASKAEEQPKSAESPKPATCYPPPLAPLCYDNGSANPVLNAFNASFSAMRTCNNCIGSFAEKEFLHCTQCEDFDLCKPCFARNQHGHHPMHGFTPAVSGTEMSENIKVKLAPGRNQLHHAICDGCDKYIMGVRHKCLDCPDWDYCATCQPNAHFVHPGHRFVPIFTRLADSVRVLNKSVHQGICCDGPLCANGKGYPSYIRGTRYKCAVCDDVDFCANCEAHPHLNHNKTHPLIKIKTPVRHINVTTTGEKGDGSPMRVMGDGASVHRSPAPVQPSVAAKAPEVKPAPGPAPVSVSVKEEKLETPNLEAPKKSESSEPAIVAEPLITLTTKPSVVKSTPEPKEQDLNATFVRDTVVDGTIMPPNHVFEQSWVLRNEGPAAWPAGCSVKYVGGDYMGHVDSNHPAEISKLVSASESIVCYEPLVSGQEFAFTVLLRTPSRPGKFVSYWRLSTPDGLKFGHRLWCDVVVREVKVEQPRPVKLETVQEPTTVTQSTTTETDTGSDGTASTMIFPKLDKESPAASTHELARAPSTIAPSTVADDKVSSTGVPDDSAEDEDWDVSEDGFLTDEEYDILDASDEEFLEEQARKMQK